MKITYHPLAADDLDWFRHYYARVFPQGAMKARQHFKQLRQALLDNPLIGAPVSGLPQMREIALARTPFSLIYTVRGDDICVLRLWDCRRGDKPAE